MKIENQVLELPELNYNKKDPGFGVVQVPVMLSSDVSHDQPTPDYMYIHETQNLNLSPFSSSLHYGQSIFEGLKVYRVSNDKVAVYRLMDHIKRFNQSAEIMCMPQINEEQFFEACIEYIKTVKAFVPSEDKHSLYLRPIMFANDDAIKVRISDNYKFLVLGSIVGDYFAGREDMKTKILASKKYARAFKGGTGEAKTAANYAISLPALKFANSLGYQQVVYLDAETRENIEELGGMNFFWVEGDVLCTPKLSGQILHGITRKSILEIAKILNIKTDMRVLKLEELKQKTLNGDIKEIFASGTAAVMTPIDELGLLNEDDSIDKLEYSNFPIMQKIRSYLLKTQAGKTEYSKKTLTYI
jgi:branched-chain amino acid aminotransferase